MKIGIDMELECSVCGDSLSVWVDSEGRGRSQWANKALIVEPCEKCMKEKDEKIDELEEKVSSLEEDAPPGAGGGK